MEEMQNDTSKMSKMSKMPKEAAALNYQSDSQEPKLQQQQLSRSAGVFRSLEPDL